MRLDSRGKKPLYEQIYDHIKNEIQSGRIAAGEKLPSTRVLSSHLQVSRSTATEAYDQLLSEGYIESLPYKGYYAAHIESMYQLRPREKKRNLVKNEEPLYRYDFSPNAIDMEHFPYYTWRRLTKECLMEENGTIFQQGDSQGDYSLRDTIANYLHHARGVQCRSEQIIVGAGSDFLFMLLGVILGEEMRIIMESPTYRQAYEVFKSLGHTPETIAMDENGMRMDQLKTARGNVAYIMPSHQFPLGIVMPLKRRMELLEWACEDEKRFIIEDDHDSEFRYKGKPIPALQGYDVNDKVIYMGTFSKSIAPAIRVSYMVIPESLLEKYRQRAVVFSSTVSRIDQSILKSFIEGGYFERHLNKMRAIYRAKHDIVIREMKKCPAVKSVKGTNAGIHILLKLEEPCSEEQLICSAQKKGLKVYGLRTYMTGDNFDQKQSGIILGYGGISQDKLKEALSLLLDAWKK